MIKTEVETLEAPNIFQFCREHQIPLTIFKLNIINGDKRPITYKSMEGYPDIKLPWTLYNKKECKLVNDFIISKKLEWNALNIMPSQKNFVIVDFDSEEELEVARAHGFPVGGYHTLSSRKRLPHYFVKLDKMIKPVRGKNFSNPREIDILTDNTFELSNNEVYGDWIIHMSHKDIGKLLNIDEEYIQLDDITFKQRRDKHLHPKKKVRKISNNFVSVKKKYVRTNDILSGIYNVNEGMEIIPYSLLVKALDALDTDKISYEIWRNIVICVANSVKTGEDPYKYLDKLDEWSQTFTNYKPSYLEENEKLFTTIYQEADSREPRDKLGISYLLKELKKHNREVWIECCFNQYRPIEAKEFKHLSIEEALKAFNTNHAVIKGDNAVSVVSWCNIKKDYRFYSEEALKKNYRNLKCRIMAKPEKFIEKWLDWEGRKTYENEGFFPKITTPYKFFNSFTGYEIERVDDYDELVHSLSKEDLETELEFILQHHRYIVGGEKQEELYQQLLMYLAHMYQYPSVLPRVSWCIWSKQGTGKNQMLNIHKNILGQLYFVSTQKGEQLFGSFNSLLNNKLLVNLNEVRNIQQYCEDIKVVISDEMISTTRKFKETNVYRNYTRLFQFANSPNHFILELSDRRHIVCKSEVKHKFIEGYMEKLHKQVNSLYIQKCLFRYLTKYVKVDKHYNFEKNRPLTKEYVNIRNRFIPYTHRYLKYLVNKGIKKNYTAKNLWTAFVDFCEDRKEKMSLSYDKFLNDINKQVLDETPSQENLDNPDVIFYKIGRPHKDRTYYYIDKARLTLFMSEYGYDWEEEYKILDDEEE